VIPREGVERLGSHTGHLSLAVHVIPREEIASGERLKIER
jgi:hypothetical protein